MSTIIKFRGGVRAFFSHIYRGKQIILFKADMVIDIALNFPRNIMDHVLHINIFVFFNLFYMWSIIKLLIILGRLFLEIHNSMIAFYSSCLILLIGKSFSRSLTFFFVCYCKLHRLTDSEILCCIYTYHTSTRKLISPNITLYRH